MNITKLITGCIITLCALIQQSGCDLLTGQNKCQNQETIVDYPSLIQNYRSIIEKRMDKSSIKGLAIALIDNDTLVWSEGLGYSDHENNIKVDANTSFLIGSVTKIFTALGVMQLSERNLVKLSDPLKKHLPQFNMKTYYGDINDISIRSVMTHHGGIPSDIFTSIFCENPEDLTTTVDYINREYAIYPPDMIRSYSNPGYTLLGHMIQEVTNEPYTEYISEGIFNPLGMNESGFLLSMDYPDGLSKAYNRKGNLDKEFPTRDVPAGAIYSSIDDMAELAISLLSGGGETIGTETLKAMLEVQNKDIELDLDEKYGLCWYLQDSGAGLLASHSGALRNHRAIFAIAPECKLGIVILVNSENGNNVLSLYGRILEDAARIKSCNTESKISQPLSSGNENFHEIVLPDSILFRHCGYYAAPGMCFKIEKRKNTLSAKLHGLRFNLIAQPNGKYLPQMSFLGINIKKLKDVRFYFDDIINHQVIIQEQIGDGSKIIIGEKVDPPVISKEWDNRLGRYELISTISTTYDDIISDIYIKMKNDLLVFGCTIDPGNEKMQFVVNPINENEGKIMGLGRFGGGVLQFSIDAYDTEILEIYGLKLKKISN